MKKIYMLVLFMGLFGLNSFAQREVQVLSMANNGGEVDELYKTIQADSADRMAALPEQTVYVLEPGGAYAMMTEIIASNYELHITTSDPAGERAYLFPAPKGSGGYDDFLQFRQDGMLENLILTGLRPAAEGEAASGNRHNIKIYDAATLTVKNCEVSWDIPGAAFSVWSDDCSLIVEDCFIHSCGHNKSIGGNGRFLGVRGNMDTISIVNTTFFNFTDRILRNMGSEVQYTKVDHCTFIDAGGFHGALQLGKCHKADVTNNIFKNLIAFGSHSNRVAGGNANEQTQPEDDLMYVMTLDTVYSDAAFTVRNNNVYWDQEIIDLWGDSIDAPGIITPTLLTQAGGDAASAYFQEELTFSAGPPSTFDYFEAAITDYNAVEFPENFYHGTSDEVDVSYGTTADSYTAGDDGFPVGDLNAQCAEMKAAWLAGEAPTCGGDGGTSINQALNDIDVTVYPNPFTSITNISFNLSDSDYTTLKVYNVLGSEVVTLVNMELNAGSHTYELDASELNSGMYFYILKSGNQVSSHKLMLVK